MIERAKSLWGQVQRTRPWRAFSHFTDVGGNVLAAGMSYQALFAVFAGLWLGFGVFGIVLSGRPELLHAIIEQINVLVPGLIGSGGIVHPQTLLEARTFSWVSAVAAASLFWMMLNWFTGTRRSIRIIFDLDVKQYRSAISLKLRDLALALLFGVAILLSAALTLLSTNLTAMLFDWLGWDEKNWLLTSLGHVTRYGAMFVFDVVVLMGVHRFLAEVRVPKLNLLSGCILGGFGLLGLKVLGTLLLGGASKNPLLATFAVLIGVLIWFNFICRVLLLTSTWIATGLDRSLGLPQQPVSSKP